MFRVNVYTTTLTTVAIFKVVQLVAGQAAVSSASQSISIKQEGPNICNNSAWQLTYEGFADANTTNELSSWWSTRNSSDIRFDQALGDLFSSNNFQCGIDLPQCTIPTCFDFTEQNLSAWVYQAANSIENLNVMYNRIYQGIAIGQADATNLNPLLADTFYKWRDPVWDWSEVINWVSLALTVLFTFGAGVIAPEGVLGAVALSTLGPLSNAGGNQVQISFQPSPGLSRNVGLDDLSAFCVNASSIAREFWETYADQTFAGHANQSDNITIDSIKGGAFVNTINIPSQSAAGDSFKTSLMARAANGLWLKQPVYIVAASGELESCQHPTNAAWRSPKTNRTYVPYYFDGHAQQEPPGLSALNGSFFGIYASQIAEAAGRAYEYAGNDYTTQIATQRILESFSSNGTLTPFQDGAGWEGTFTWPVCYVGTHSNWMPTYGGRELPCYCGSNGSETRLFIEKANLNKSFEWWEMCRNQLAGTDIDFKAIDYGIDPGTPASRWWYGYSPAKRGGIAFGIVFGFCISALISCCCCCLWCYD